MGCQALPEFGILGLADETDCDEGSLLQLIGTRCDILDQDVHKFGPFIARKFDSGNGDDKLGGRLGGTAIFRGQGLERKFLDLGLDFEVDLLNPSRLHLA